MKDIRYFPPNQHPKERGMRRSPVFLIDLLTAPGGFACSGGKSEAASATTAAAPADGGLTPFQQENGIGPVTQAITLGPIDRDEAEEGKKIFEGKCMACHKMTERY